jgi:hypothetical protein
MKINREEVFEYLLKKCDHYPGVFFDNLCFDFSMSRTLAKKIVQEFIEKTDRFIIQKKVKVIINNHPNPIGKSEEDIAMALLEEVIRKEGIMIGLLEKELTLIDKRIEQNEILKTIPDCGCQSGN